MARTHASFSLRLAAALLAAALAACDLPTLDAPAAPTEHVTPVRVAAVGNADTTRELRLPGVLRAVQRAEPAFLHSGQLAERFVARGERVAAGQQLASLRNPALAPTLAAAEARVRELDERLLQLDADYQRARELHARDLASAELLDRTLAERNATRQARAQAQARVTEAREQFGDSVLRAPFDGVVSELLVEPGDFVAAGQPVLALAGAAGLEAVLQLPEGLTQRLLLDAPAEVRAVASGARAQGRLREIGVARAGRPAPAVVALEVSGPPWEPGLSVHVGVTERSPPALTVPLGAVLDPGTGQTRVFRIVDGRAVAVPIAAGRLVGAHIEVGGALGAGDLVVIAGHQQLLDGEAVRILP